MDIKFGTDGWRAIIAREFTTANVARIAAGTALWALNKKKSPAIVVGHDCRFAGELFAGTVARVLTNHGVKVYMANGFVSAPMVSMATKNLGCTLGVFITASHNPPLYNGYKLKGHYGGPLLEREIGEVEAMIPRSYEGDISHEIFDREITNGLFEYVDLESMYCKYLENKFDIESIRKSGLRFAFDAMYGSGQNVMRNLFPDIKLLHCERQPLFGGIPPEPLAKNLKEFSDLIRQDGKIDCGLAVDGDADRTALLDDKGNYIDSHHVILLLIQYLHNYKKITGKVATGFSSTVKIGALCKHYNIPLDVVQIGFKHICGIMLEEQVIVGGEESGGIAVAGHIPERDGIFNGLLIWEAMVKTGKSLRELIDEIYAITGHFAFERSDLILTEKDKQRILKNCRDEVYSAFGPYKVIRTETLDGFKYYFSDNQWLMIRASGTEPLLRTYAEGEDRETALHILKNGYDTLLNDSENH